MKLPKTGYRLTVSPVEGGYALDISAERFAKNVRISTDAPGFFSDNYFDLLPGEQRRVLFRTEADISLSTKDAGFKLESLVDTLD
jgi:beta-mannosidase